MGKYNLPDDNNLTEVIMNLQKRIERLENTTRAIATAIDQGDLTVRGGGSIVVEDGGGVRIEDGGDLDIEDAGNLRIRDGGRLRVFFPDNNRSAVYGGPIHNANTNAYLGTGLLVQTLEEGDPILTAYTDPDTGARTFRVHDATDRPVIAISSSASRGLAHPRMNIPFVPKIYTSMAGNDSTSFATIMEGNSYCYTQRLRIRISGTMDTSGATGEMRVLINGNVVIGPSSLPFGIINTVHDVDIPNDVNIGTSQITIELQTRRVSGSGFARASIVMCAMIQ